MNRVYKKRTPLASRYIMNKATNTSTADLPVHENLEDHDEGLNISDESSLHSSPAVSNSSIESVKKPLTRKRSKRINKYNKDENLEKTKKLNQAMIEHFSYIQSIKTELYEPIKTAVEVFKIQNPDTKHVNENAIKKHILKNYNKILDCRKIINKWMISAERLKEIKFCYIKYKNSKTTNVLE